MEQRGQRGPCSYTRLEQGYDHHPSREVLEGLARALRLDDDAAAHLFALSRPGFHRPPAPAAAAERVRPELQDLLDAWTMTSAIVFGRRLDVLASNQLARTARGLGPQHQDSLRRDGRTIAELERRTVVAPPAA